MIYDAHENHDTIHADHIGIAKFSSRDDNQYRKVLNAIENLLEKLTEDELARGKHSM